MFNAHLMPPCEAGRAPGRNNLMCERLQPMCLGNRCVSGQSVRITAIPSIHSFKSRHHSDCLPQDSLHDSFQLCLSVALV